MYDILELKLKNVEIDFPWYEHYRLDINSEMRRQREENQIVR